ncbi:hypothetical protein [Bacillus toyonensis]|uniref:hypothetical protein n=1 Tax=Bacillus toyonensis TaxID=155322 RepID=UPI002E21D127|nr:hypothetical protein [Bacillus toyonensis]
MLRIFTTSGVILLSMLSLFGVYWLDYVEYSERALKLYGLTVFALLLLFICWMRLFPYKDGE